MTERYLIARFDISHLSEEEVDALAGEVTAQADRSPDHPSVGVEVETVDKTKADGDGTLTPIPGRAGWRCDSGGREFYSAAWLRDGTR